IATDQIYSLSLHDALPISIEKAILMANLGVTPQNDGDVIRIFMPPVTEERRKELVKKANAEGEQGKISVRNIRRDAIEQIKKLQDRKSTRLNSSHVKISYA